MVVSSGAQVFEPKATAFPAVSGCIPGITEFVKGARIGFKVLRDWQENWMRTAKYGSSSQREDGWALCGRREACKDGHMKI